MAHKPEYAVPALEKGLDILETLSNSPIPLTLSALAKTLQRSNNEIFRMLSFLEDRRYILRDESGAYRLSLRLFEIANAQNPIRRLIDVARPAMRTLVETTSESCHLSILEGAEIIVLETVECNRPVRLSIAVGARFDAAITASGRILLADLPEESRNAVLEESMAYRKMKAGERKELKKVLHQLSKDRFTSSVSESVGGVTDAAIGVGNAENGIHAAIAISALSPGKEMRKAEEFRLPLEVCSNSVSMAMGGYHLQ